MVPVDERPLEVKRRVMFCGFRVDCTAIKSKHFSHLSLFEIYWCSDVSGRLIFTVVSEVLYPFWNVIFVNH